MGKPIEKVIIVGAGPVGLLTALMLAQEGISVDLLEANQGIDQRPRGAAYGPSAVRVLRRAGVIDKIRTAGFSPKDMSWRQLGGAYITGIKGISADDEDRTAILPVHLLTELLYEETKQYSSVKVHWGCKFTGFIQDEDKATVHADHRDETLTFSGEYVLGADGARSDVRKALFGDSFPGRSLDVRIVATDVQYDGFDKHGWSDVQWIIHPEHWALVCRLDTKGTWRVSYGESYDIPVEGLRERLASKFEQILPGKPGEGDYELTRWSPFVLHHRLAERMQVGRVLLAGDAAHLCNPMGGLGLTGGIADVGSLVDCLIGIHRGEADVGILEKYDEKRREIYQKVTDPTASANLERLFQDGATALQNDPVLQYINAVSQDPVMAQQMLKNLDTLTVDMKVFWNSRREIMLERN